MARGAVGEAQYQRWRNQMLMNVLCSGLRLRRSASGSLNGADIRAPPGMAKSPKIAGITAMRTLLGRTPLRPSMSSEIRSVSLST